MTIVTVQFDYLHSKIYSDLMAVFEYSLKQNFPEAKLKVYTLKPNENWKAETFRRGFHSNKIKFDKWVESLDEIDDDKIIFMDCDMLVLQPLDEVFEYDFDLGVTYRTKIKLPFNGGVVFARNNKNTKNFFKLWCEIDDKMYKDKVWATPWRAKYAGLNQASFGYLFENDHLYTCDIKEFPCSVYNECGENRFNPNITKCIHIKSGTRRACFAREAVGHIDPEKRGFVKEWRKYAQEAGVYDGSKEKNEIKIVKKMKAKSKTRRYV